MTGEDKKSVLAEWGSRESTGLGRLGLWLVALAVVVVLGGVGLWAAGNYGDDLQDLEDQLNSRYQETISVGTQQINGSTLETFTVDGVRRPDCDATPEGFLSCSDDPQPTPES